MSVTLGLPDSEAPGTTMTEDTVDGVVDYKGRPVIRSRYGRWKSAAFIIGVEVAERISFYGMSSNLMSYLIGPLKMSTAAAAVNVNAWAGVANLLPILTAAIADSFLGRYRTVVIASFIYILGLGLLTLSATVSFHNHSNCHHNSISTSDCQPHLQLILVFVSLYLVAVGQAGHKPCVQAFAADQFDGHHPEESVSKSSFFNWWYFFLCLGPMLTMSGLNYIQDNIGWGLGFGIPCALIFIALVVFLLGTVTYRYAVKNEENGPFTRIVKVFVGAIRNRHVSSSLVLNVEAGGILPRSGSRLFRFLYKAVLAPDGSKGNVSTIIDVEDTIILLRLLPIWAICLIYGIVYAQLSTFYTKQGITLDRSIGKLTVPAAALQSFVSLFTLLFVVIYDRIFVPLARRINGKPAGITKLQRIGVGLFISVIEMIVAALVERMRLHTALEHGLIDSPKATVPMSLWWMIPQYALIGIVDVFIMVGLPEFFYDQVPSDLRSVGLSLYLSIFGVGSLLSSVLISAIKEITGGNGGGGWFNDNINRGHLDYFYWLLAGLSALELVIFMSYAKFYVYNTKSGTK